jgi:signal transduction histidine kinase
VVTTRTIGQGGAAGLSGGAALIVRLVQRDTEGMIRKAIWLARITAFVVIGSLVLADPPRGSLAAAVQIAGFSLIGLAMVGWLLVEEYPSAARFSSWGLPVSLGVITAAGGFACTVQNAGNGQSLIAFAAVATAAAGTEIDLNPAMIVTGIGALALEIGALTFNSDYGIRLGFALIMLVGLLVGRNRRGYRIQAEQSATLLAQYKQLQAEQRRGDILDERARIAREIHDVLAHSLGALGIQIQAARAVLTDHRDIDRAIEVLLTAQRMASDGLAETRRAVHALRVDTLPLNEELAAAVGTHQDRYHVPVSFDTGGEPKAVPPDARIALLRTAQEALVNAAKHAPGEHITMRLDYGEHDVRLSVLNNLTGVAAADQVVADQVVASTVNGGYGLTGMRERLRLLNGTLRAGPQDDQWAVTAELPLTVASEPENMVS